MLHVLPTLRSTSLSPPRSIYLSSFDDIIASRVSVVPYIEKPHCGTASHTSRWSGTENPSLTAPALTVDKEMSLRVLDEAVVSIRARERCPPQLLSSVPPCLVSAADVGQYDVRCACTA